MTTPNYSEWINEIFGWPDEVGGSWATLASAANIVVGQNPPYSASDFLLLYPKWFGRPTNVTATTDGTTAVLTNVSNVSGLAKGQLVTGAGIADGSTIASISGSTVTLSLVTTAAGTGVALAVYTAPLVPLAIINTYTYLAQNSIFQVRWFEMWPTAMGLFIDHYVTLWAYGNASGPNATGAQAAASGLAIGIKTSKSVGDVSVGIKALELDIWGSFSLTLSGSQLVTLAKMIGSGIQVIY